MCDDIGDDAGGGEVGTVVDSLGKKKQSKLVNERLKQNRESCIGPV